MSSRRLLPGCNGAYRFSCCSLGLFEVPRRRNDISFSRAAHGVGASMHSGTIHLNNVLIAAITGAWWSLASVVQPGDKLVFEYQQPNCNRAKRWPSTSPMPSTDPPRRGSAEWQSVKALTV